MQLTITNLGSEQIFLSDLYTTIAAGGSVTTSRSESDLSRMASVQSAIAAGLVTVTVTPTANEEASGMLSGLGVTSAIAPTAAVGENFEVRKSFVAGTPGTPDDVTIFAVGTLPFKFRVENMEAIIATAIGATTLQARTRAGGAGTLLQEVASALTGHQDPTATVTASAVATPGAAEGLFLRRSDRGVAGEVVITCRRET